MYLKHKHLLKCNKPSSDLRIETSALDEAMEEESLSTSTDLVANSATTSGQHHSLAAAQFVLKTRMEGSYHRLHLMEF